MNNYTKLLEFAEKKNGDYKNTVINFKTSFYSMNINADYKKMILRLKDAKDLLTKL